MLRSDPTFRPKFVYCIPAFHNPTGYSLSVSRRAHLCCLAAEFDFMVLADEVYQLLAFNGVERPADPLCYFDTDEVIKHGGKGGKPGHVLSIGSFAKITAPGLRLGWLQVSPAAVPIIKRIYNCGQLDSSGALNPVVSGIVHTMIESGSQDEHLAAVRTELTQRGAVLGDALRQHLPPGATFVQPRGGYFIWISIPQPLHGMRLMDYCIANHKCRFHPGERFGTGLDSFIRLSFSYYSAPDLAVGAQRLGEAMRAMLSASSPSSTSLPPLGTYTPRSSSSISATPVRVAVHGAAGRLGSLIAGALSTSGTFAGVVGRGGSSLPETSDVVIDVTLPAGTAALVSALNNSQRPLPLIVGTTGDLPIEALTAYSKRAPVVICANFSVGVPLLLSMIASLKGPSSSSSSCSSSSSSTSSILPVGWSAEVTEIHHTAKLDAPSGTAKRLLSGLEAAGVQSAAAFAAGGGAEAVKANPIPVHALRLGDTVGVHTVFLAGPGERIELTHTATKREVFAIGAVRVATWAAQQPAGLYYK
jgi:dihydrodipicolinate reductase